jgi:exodeoxyribonuclease III
VIRGFGSSEFDARAATSRLQFGKLSVVSLYLPSGSSSEERQAGKFRFLDAVPAAPEKLRRGSATTCSAATGTSRTRIDLKNWRSNQKNSGFLPEERAWLDRCSGE